METASDRVRRARPLLGTFVEIVVLRAEPEVMEAAIRLAFDAVERVHRLMSFHDPESDVSRLNRDAAFVAVTIDPWTFQVLEIAVELHRRSAGVFDVAVAPVLQAMGLLPGPTFERAPGGLDTRIDEMIELLPGHRVRFRNPRVAIDLGGIAKGFAVDRALDVLRAHHLPQGLVNAGGDLAAFGQKPETVAIRDPRDSRRLIGSTQLANEALASSGGGLDLFESSNSTPSTIINPRTRQPACGIAGATVRAPDCVTADALTKIVMILGDASVSLLDHYGASALVVSAEGDVHVTSSWQDTKTLAA
jgi:thiamine biosynthesis lipoprotein